MGYSFTAPMFQAVEVGAGQQVFGSHRQSLVCDESAGCKDWAGSEKEN
jgi:hypothetical protein